MDGFILKVAITSEAEHTNALITTIKEVIERNGLPIAIKLNAPKTFKMLLL